MGFELGNGYGFAGWMARALATERRSDWRGHPEPLAEDGDRYWMHQALLAAMDHIGLAPPNPIVGAVFVKDGRLLAKGATLKWGDLHGERHALQMIKDPRELQGATAYVLLEPCSHQGQQPPCVDALIASGIKRCVIACGDPNPKVAGEGIAKLKKAGIEVVIGVMAGEAIAWNFPFFGEQLLGRPMVMAKWAQTLDGHLADDKDQSQWISGPSARSLAHWFRQKCDAVMVGAGTVLADHPRLNVRDAALPHNRHPLKIIFDPFGRIVKLSEAKFATIQSSTLSGPEAAYIGVQRQHWEALADKKRHPIHKMDHLQFVVLDDPRGHELQEFMIKLAGIKLPQNRRIQSILVEGGPALLTLMAQRDLIDSFHCFIAPAILGGRKNRIGTVANRGDGPRQAAIDKLFAQMERYRLMGTHQLGNDVLMEFIPQDRYQKIFASKPG